MTNAQGIDISAHQSTTPSLAGLDFMFARATYGDTPDPMYRKHTTAARAAGLVVGAYHFGRSGQYVSIRVQVAAFLASAVGAQLLALDLEADGHRNAPMSDIEAAQFMALVQQSGRAIGLYHSDSGYPGDLGQNWRWVAKWSSTPPRRRWDFWQKRGSPLDLDEYHGTAADLRAFAAQQPPDTSTGEPMNLNIEEEYVPLHNITGAKGATVYDLAGNSTNTTLAEAEDRACQYLVQVPGDTTHHYYAARWPGGGPGPDLMLLRKADVTDHGATDTSAQIAKLEADLATQKALVETLTPDANLGKAYRAVVKMATA